MTDFALDFLLHYGYLRGNSGSLAVSPSLAATSLAKALADYQSAAGLTPTGEFDQATEAKMHVPRCGCLDVQRSVAEWSRWRKNSLTYKITDYVGGLSKGDVDDLVRLAWTDWMNVADLKIAPTTGTPDIVISTGKGRADGFDGPGSTLAWAFLPSGDDGQLLCRFDLDERWLKENPQNGILFRNVACHEFGHLLGLEHSRNSNALMAPYYTPGIVNPQQADDIPRIQALYGKATSPPANPPPQFPVPAGAIRFLKPLAAGQHGDIVLGSDAAAGDFGLGPVGVEE